MKRLIFCLLLFCFIQCQTVYAADSWPNNAIENTTTKSNGKGVRIAVIDTGISVNAIDKARIAGGMNYITDDSDTEDKIGHGTAMAGIIIGMESKELIGIAPDAMLVPLVYCTKDKDGNIVNGNTTTLAKCIRDAVDGYKCQVLLIGAGTNENSNDLQAAIEHAEEKGVVVISSVGNENEDYPEYVYYPAAYKTVLGVTALREDGDIATFSQRNSSVALSAPGTELKVATINGRTVKAYGTSYAAAFVAGAAVQILSEYQELTPEQVRKALCNTAKDICAKGYDTDSGYGVLQVKAALANAKSMHKANRKEASQALRNIAICLLFVILLSSVAAVIMIRKRRAQNKIPDGQLHTSGVNKDNAGAKDQS